MISDLLKCMVGCADGCIIFCDAINHENKLWLVVSWLEHPNKPHAKPERLIRFDNLPHQRSEDEDGLDYLNIQLPISSIELLDTHLSGIEFLDHPPNLYVERHLLHKN